MLRGAARDRSGALAAALDERDGVRAKLGAAEGAAERARAEAAQAVANARQQAAQLGDELAAAQVPDKDCLEGRTQETLLPKGCCTQVQQMLLESGDPRTARWQGIGGKANWRGITSLQTLQRMPPQLLKPQKAPGSLLIRSETLPWTGVVHSACCTKLLRLKVSQHGA